MPCLAEIVSELRSAIHCASSRIARKR